MSVANVNLRPGTLRTAPSMIGFAVVFKGGIYPFSVLNKANLSIW